MKEKKGFCFCIIRRKTRALLMEPAFFAPEKEGLILRTAIFPDRVHSSLD
jgi:hypothetical protein